MWFPLTSYILHHTSYIIHLTSYIFWLFFNDSGVFLFFFNIPLFNPIEEEPLIPANEGDYYVSSEM